MKLSPQYFHWQFCRQFLEKIRVNFTLLGTGSLSRAQEGRTASLGPLGGSLAANQKWCLLLQKVPSVGKKRSSLCLPPHPGTYWEEEKKELLRRSPNLLDYQVLSMTSIFLLFSPCMRCKFAMHVLNLKRSHLDQCHPISLSQPNTFQLRRPFDIQELSLRFMCTKLTLLMVPCGPFCNFLWLIRVTLLQN